MAIAEVRGTGEREGYLFWRQDQEETLRDRATGINEEKPIRGDA